MMNNNQKKKSEIRVGGGGVEWWGGGVVRRRHKQNFLQPQYDHNSLKIRQGKITTLQITIMESYKEVSSFERQNWKMLALNFVTELLAN